MQLLRLAICVLVGFLAANQAHAAVLLKSGPGIQVKPDGTNTSAFMYFAGPNNFVADDGVYTQDREGGFSVRSVPFNLTVPQLPYVGVLDHAKWVVTTAKPFDIGPEQMLRIRAKVAAQITVPPTLPEGFAAASKEPSNDMRLACAALLIIDFSTGMTFNFHITNKGVWPFYERLPFARSATDFYRGFSSTYKGATRQAPEQPADLEVTYDRANGTVTWSIDGNPVQTITSIGAFPPKSTKFNPVVDLGGQDPKQPLDIKTLSLGFTTFSLLDFTDPNDPASDTGLVQLTANVNGTKNYVRPATFVDPKSTESSRLFGAGAVLKVYDYSVELL